MPRRDRIAATARQVEALHLRARGLPYEAVGEALGITKQAAFKLVSRALAATLQEAGEQLRQLELRRLDNLLTEAAAVLERTHYYMQGGKVVIYDGAPLRDDGPTLAAIGQLVRLGESRRRLLGLDAPAKVDMKLSLQAAWARATPEERDAVVAAELAELQAELDRRGPSTPPGAEMLPPETTPAAGGDVDRLAEALAAGLAAAGVDLDQVDLDRVADAVESYLERRSGPLTGGRP